MSLERQANFAVPEVSEAEKEIKPSGERNPRNMFQSATWKV